jgi:1-acyl-sn-glycerol-3-phosphate acyltransferase
MFDPKTKKYPYPELTDRHYLVVKKNRGIVFDADYPYVDRSRAFRFKQTLFRIPLRLIVLPLTRIRLGLRIKGKKNLRKNRELLSGGAITCSNHVHLWDYLAILNVFDPKKTHVIVWAPNVNGESGNLVRMVGGIPVPESGVAATKAELAAIEGALGRGEFVQLYAEGSMWEYYCPIRPFKRGIGYLAAKTGKPVIPMAFSYREPGWIRKHFFRQIALFNLNIGEPLMADESLEPKERETDLVIRAHRAVCKLAGIDPDKNIYGPVFNNTRRVDYY